MCRSKRECQQAAIGAVSAIGRAGVIGVIRSFGAESIGAVPPERYSALYDALKTARDSGMEYNRGCAGEHRAVRILASVMGIIGFSALVLVLMITLEMWMR